MRNLIIFIGCAMPLFMACSQPLASDFDAEDAVIQHNSKTISIDNALMALEDLLSQTEIKTRSSFNSITKDDIFVIGGAELSPKTRSGAEMSIPDTLLYAVNFSDGGYSILSANTDLNSPIMCITDKGTISPESFASGYSLLMSTESNNDIETRSSDEDYLENVVCKDGGKDYLYSLLISAAILDYYDNKTIYDQEPETRESASTKVGPLLKTKWTQDSPFNWYKNPPGCAVIAAGQIMAYMGKPTTSVFSSVTVPWTTLRTVYPSSNPNSLGITGAADQVALFAQELGNSSNCDVDSGGGTTINKVKTTLEKYGYDVTKRIGCASGDKKKITTQIVEKNKPVYMRGQRKSSNGQIGHAWVIDGVMNDMFHVNWGWHGDADGYYAKGVFNTAERQSYDSSDSGDNSYTGASTRNYYHYFRFLLI